MRIKTNRDIKSSLDVARKQKMPSITSKIEEMLKAESEEEFGPILTEEEVSEIAQKEKERKTKQDLALKKSRMKIMRVKEKIKETQRIRQELLGAGANPKVSRGSGKEKRSKITPLGKESHLKGFKKMNVKY